MDPEPTENTVFAKNGSQDNVGVAEIDGSNRLVA